MLSVKGDGRKINAIMVCLPAAILRMPCTPAPNPGTCFPPTSADVLVIADQRRRPGPCHGAASLHPIQPSPALRDLELRHILVVQNLDSPTLLTVVVLDGYLAALVAELAAAHRAPVTKLDGSRSLPRSMKSTHIICGQPPFLSIMAKHCGHRFQSLVSASARSCSPPSTSLSFSVEQVPQCDFALHFLHVLPWQLGHVPTLSERLLSGMKVLQAGSWQYSLCVQSCSSRRSR